MRLAQVWTGLVFSEDEDIRNPEDCADSLRDLELVEKNSYYS